MASKQNIKDIIISENNTFYVRGGATRSGRKLGSERERGGEGGRRTFPASETINPFHVTPARFFCHRNCIPRTRTSPIVFAFIDGRRRRENIRTTSGQRRSERFYRYLKNAASNSDLPSHLSGLIVTATLPDKTW